MDHSEQTAIAQLYQQGEDLSLELMGNFGSTGYLWTRDGGRREDVDSGIIMYDLLVPVVIPIIQGRAVIVGESYYTEVSTRHFQSAIFCNFFNFFF